MSSLSAEHEATDRIQKSGPITGINNDNEKATGGLDDLDEAPDGGAKAWLVAAAASCVFFSCLGFVNSFGIFVEYYLTHQLSDRTADEVAWIGSLTAFIQFAAGAIAGPLFDRFGAWIIRPAAVVYVFAIMMTSLCQEYWQFMLAQGVLLGASLAMLQFPAMAAVSQYFDKKRATALGLTISGSSIGGVVIPIALSKMLTATDLGFGWSVRIIGFLVTPLLAFSCSVITSRLPPRKSTFFIWSAFSDARYVLLIVSTFFQFIGLFTPLFFLPAYAVTRNIDATLASYLLAIVNAASTFGRIIPGLLADRLGRLNVFAAGGVITGIVICCMNEARTTAALVVYALAFGFCSGTIISGSAAAITLCPRDMRDIGTYMGMGLAVASLAALIGPPASGAIIDRYGGFFQVSIFSGVMCLFGGLTAYASKYV